MKSRVLLLIGVITLFLLFGVWGSKIFLRDKSTEPNPRAGTVVPNAPLSNSSSGTGTQATSGQGSIEFAAAHLTSILFYGKAVDQNGVPVPDATVTYRANNIPWGGGVRSQMKTDAPLVGSFKFLPKDLVYTSKSQRIIIDPCLAAPTLLLELLMSDLCHPGLTHMRSNLMGLCISQTILIL